MPNPKAGREEGSLLQSHRFFDVVHLGTMESGKVAVHAANDAASAARLGSFRECMFAHLESDEIK